MGKRELAALLSLSSWCLVGFSESAHLLGLVWAFVTVQISHVMTQMGDWMPFCASSEGSGESAHLHRLTLAFSTVQNLLCCLKWRFVCYSRQQRILWWVCIFAQAKSLDNVINIKISFVGSKCSFESARLHRLVWAFFIVSKYHVLVEMSILVTFMWTVIDVVSLQQQPQDFCETISALYQCFKKCSQCVVIEFLNKTFASLPRKKYKVVISFFCYFMGIWQQLRLDMQISLNLGCYTRKKHLSRHNSRTLLDLQSNHELNHQLLGRAINCYVTGGLCARFHHK